MRTVSGLVQRDIGRILLLRVAARQANDDAMHGRWIERLAEAAGQHPRAGCGPGPLIGVARPSIGRRRICSIKGFEASNASKPSGRDKAPCSRA